jgi:predicted AAA+ superfamily ATPase
MSIDMSGYIERDSLKIEILEKLNESPAVALLGARQVGKTTLAREICGSSAESVFRAVKGEDTEG